MKGLTNLTSSYYLAVYILASVLLIKILFVEAASDKQHSFSPDPFKQTRSESHVIVAATASRQISLIPHVDVLIASGAVTLLLALLRLSPTRKKASSENQSTPLSNTIPKSVRRYRSAELKTISEDYFNAIEVLTGLTQGDYSKPVPTDTQRPLPLLLHTIQDQLKAIVDKDKLESWVQTNMYGLEKLLKEDHNQSVLNAEIVKLLCKSVGAGVGILYNWNTEGYFNQIGSYGFYDNLRMERKIPGGEGQLGELSNHKAPVFLNDLPKGYIVIQSGLGSATATNVAIFPLLFKGELYGAIELALFRPLIKNEISWMERAAESIGAHLFNYKINQDAKLKLEELTRKQAEELVEVHRLQQSTFEKLESKLKEVEDERVKNEAILDGCVDGVITFNEQGIIEFCNGVAEEILVRKRDAINGKPVQELMPIEIGRQDEIWKAFYVSPSAKKEIGVRTEATLTTSDGETVDVLMTCTKVTHKGGMIFTFFIQKISVDLF